MPASARHTGWRRDHQTGRLHEYHEGTRVDAILNVKRHGAIGDDSADDTTAIQEAIDTAIADGGGMVGFPAGTYRITAGLNLDGASNLVLQGMGRATINAVVASPSTADAIFMTTDQRPFKAGNLTYYDLTGTHNRGDSVLNFATAADAGNFTVGDYIWVRTRQTLTSGDEQPIAELNRVRAADDTAGTVTLDWPLAKEYTDDGENPYGVAVASGVGVNNAIRGLRLVTEDIRTTNLHQQINHTFEDCEFDAPMGPLPHGRFIAIRNNRGHTTPDYDTFNSARYVQLDRGACDVLMQGNHWSSEGTGGLHIHEGVANVTCVGNTYYQAASDPDAPSTYPVISIKATAWDIRFIGETIINAPLETAIRADDSVAYPGIGLGSNGVLVSGVTILGSTAGSIVTMSSGANGAVIGNRLLATAGSHALNIQDTDVIVSGNDVGDNTVDIIDGALRGRNRGAGDIFGTPSALTAEDASTVDSTYGTEEADVINNLRTRQGEIEAILQQMGAAT